MPNYCFETPNLKEIFSKIHSYTSGEVYSFEELVEKFSNAPKPQIENTTSLQNTIRLLRESLILTEDHIAHCFSVLPDTPKNKLIREELSKYVHLSDKKDWTSIVWETIGELKEKKTKPLFDKEWVFVKEQNSSFLFQEFGKAFSYANGVESVNLSTLGRSVEVSGSSEKESRFYFSSSTDALNALCTKISKSETKIFVPFFGSPEELAYCRFYLLSLGKDLTKVEFLPWVSLPPTQYKSLAFVGESYFDLDLENIDFTFQELDILYREGFSLPNPKEIKLSRSTILNELLESGIQVFTNVPMEHWQDAKPVEWNETVQVEKNNIPLPCYSLQSSSPTYSATQLEVYASCPTKYLLANRLKLQEERIGLDALPLVNGQVVHRALELFFQENGSAVTESGLWKSFEKALEEIKVQASLTRNLKFNFEALVPKVLTLEKQLDILFGKRTPMYFEKEFALNSFGSSFKGKIDRIDALEDGRLLVLDYKTGTIDFTPEHIKKGYHFQALLYMLGTESLFSKPVIGMLFYDLKNTEIRRGILLEELVSKETKKAITRGHTLTQEKYRNLVEEGLLRAKEYCERMEAGDFAANPSSENCMYCEFSSFCRQAYGRF